MLPVSSSAIRDLLPVMRILIKLARDAATTGRIRAFHGTNLPAAERIMAEGFRPLDIGQTLKEVYGLNRIPWAARKAIPEEMRKSIEYDARSRAASGAHSTVSFSPTRQVATLWSGKLGEVPGEADFRLRMYLALKQLGLPNERVMQVVRNFDYSGEWPKGIPPIQHSRTLPGVVIQANIPLPDRWKGNQFWWLTQPYIQQLLARDPRLPPLTPRDVLKQFNRTYTDIQVPAKELKDIRITRLLRPTPIPLEEYLK